MKIQVLCYLTYLQVLQLMYSKPPNTVLAVEVLMTQWLSLFNLIPICSNLPKEVSRTARYRPRIEDNLGKSATPGQGTLYGVTAAAALGAEGAWPDRNVSQRLAKVPPYPAPGPRSADLCSLFSVAPLPPCSTCRSPRPPPSGAPAGAGRGVVRLSCVSLSLLRSPSQLSLQGSEAGEVDH